MVAAVVLAAGCSGGGDATGEEAAPSSTAPAVVTIAPTTTEPPTTTTTEPVDPFAIPSDPADIDPAYVERVINEHSRILGDALRIQLADGDPNEIIARYNAVYIPEIADLQLNFALGQSPEDLERYRVPPGDAVVSVESLDHVDATCVVALVILNADASLVDPPAHLPLEVTIRRSDDTGADTHNRTGWVSEGLTERSPQEWERCSKQ